MLQVHGLQFSYSGTTVLKDLSISIRPGEAVSLIGLSGAGKSTLFKLLTGVLQPASGEICIAGHRLPSEQQHVTYLMQEDLLLPWRSVLSNILLVAEMGPNPVPTRLLVPRARELLEYVGLKGKEEATPEELSGGQRQRVALVRALLLAKPLLLLDEPFSSLDLLCREQLYLLLRGIQQRDRVTLLMATHDFRDALCLSDRILLLDGGTITQQWTIDEEARRNPEVLHVLHQKLREAMIQSRGGQMSCVVG